jgi:hypothetical protein
MRLYTTLPAAISPIAGCLALRSDVRKWRLADAKNVSTSGPGMEIRLGRMTSGSSWSGVGAGMLVRGRPVTGC